MRWTGLICIATMLLAGCSQADQPSRPATQAVNTNTAESDDESEAEDVNQSLSDEQRASLVKAHGIQLTAPTGWERRQPSNQVILAEFGLPKAEGDELDGRLTVSVAGGGIEANIDRWRGQFVGAPSDESVREISVAGMRVTLVDFAGTYNDRQGPFAPGVERKGYRMMAAIVPSQERLNFIKAYGPRKTMDSYKEAFQEFVESIKKVE